MADLDGANYNHGTPSADDAMAGDSSKSGSDARRADMAILDGQTRRRRQRWSFLLLKGGSGGGRGSLTAIRRSARTAVWGVALGWLLPVGGCGPPKTAYPESLNSPRPEERIIALKRAAIRHDESVLHLIVDRLEDEDEAVRLYAILALERLTGTRLDYDYAAPETERWRAAQAWRRYLQERRAEDGASGRAGDAAGGGSEP